MAFGIDDAIAAGLKVLDKFIPDPEAKAKAQLELQMISKDLKLAELEAEKSEKQEISKRWQADTSSDSWLAKNIRPMVLLIILGGYFTFAMLSAFDIETNKSYVELLGNWGMVVMTAYFGSRGVEKVADTWAKARESENAK